MLKTLGTFFLTCAAVFIAFGQPQEPPSARWHFDQGLKFLSSNSFEQALAAFEASAALDPKQPAAFANIGAASIALKRFEKAESAFRAAIKLAPANGSFHTALCQALSLQKKHTDAIAACDEGIRLSPASDRAQSARLIALQAAGRNIADIQRAVDSAVARFRSSEIILDFAAGFYLMSSNYVYAATLLESLVNMQPESSRYHGALAEAYLNLGRDADSLVSARTALRLEPLNPYANYAMGLIFYELGQHEEAADSFSKARTEDPRLKYARYYLAISESRRGRIAQAVTYLRELTAQYPTDFTFQYELARTLSAADLYIESEAVYTRANDLKSGNIDVIGGLAMAYMTLAKFDKAIPLFEEMVRQKPDNEHYKMFLNVARGRQNIAPQIPAMIQEAETNPKSVKIRFDLARALAFANRIDEAEKYIDELYALDPDDDRIYQSLGVSFSEAGKLDKALEAYKKSMAKKENPAAYLGMAGIYSKRGEFELASAAYAKVIELKPDTPNIMKGYADLLRDNGKRREALDMYKRSLAILPNNGPALFHAGLLSMKLGVRGAANNYLGILKSVDPQLARQLSRCLALRIWD